MNSLLCFLKIFASILHLVSGLESVVYCMVTIVLITMLGAIVL